MSEEVTVGSRWMCTSGVYEGLVWVVESVGKRWADDRWRPCRTRGETTRDTAPWYLPDTKLFTRLPDEPTVDGTRWPVVGRWYKLPHYNGTVRVTSVKPEAACQVAYKTSEGTTGECTLMYWSGARPADEPAVDLRCSPGCTPAEPCWTRLVCPALKEVAATSNTRAYDDERFHLAGKPSTRPRTGPPTPMLSGMQSMVCPWYRSKR